MASWAAAVIGSGTAKCGWPMLRLIGSLSVAAQLEDLADAGRLDAAHPVGDPVIEHRNPGQSFHRINGSNGLGAKPFGAFSGLSDRTRGVGSLTEMKRIKCRRLNHLLRFQPLHFKWQPYRKETHW